MSCRQPRQRTGGTGVSYPEQPWEDLTPPPSAPTGATRPVPAAGIPRHLSGPPIWSGCSSPAATSRPPRTRRAPATIPSCGSRPSRRPSHGPRPSAAAARTRRRACPAPCSAARPTASGAGPTSTPVTRRTWRDRQPDRTPGSQSGLPGHDCEPGPYPPARTRKAPAGERHQYPPGPRPVRRRARRRHAVPHVHHQHPQARRQRAASGQRAHRVRHLAAGHPRCGPAVREFRRPVPVHLRRQEREGTRHDRGRDARRRHDHPLGAGHRARHARQDVQGRAVPDHDLLGRLGRDELRRRQPRQLAVRGRLHRRPGVPGHHHRPGHLRHPSARPARRHRIRLGLARTRHHRRRQARRPRRPLPAADGPRAD